MLARLYRYALIIIINYYFNVCLCSIMGVWVHSIYYVVKWSVIMKLVLLYSQGCAVCSGQPRPTHCRSLPTHSLAPAARSITRAAAAANGWLVVSPEAMSLSLWAHTHVYTCTRNDVHTYLNCYAHFCIYFRTHFRHAIIHVHTHVRVYTRWDAHVLLQYIEPLYKDTPEMQTSPLIRTLPTYGPSYIEMCIKWSLKWGHLL